MSAGARQEVMIRAMIEALCICLLDWLFSEERSKLPEEKDLKVFAIKKLHLLIADFWNRYPIKLTKKEGKYCKAKLDYFHQTQLSHPDGCKPESVIALLLALIDFMARKVKNSKNGKAQAIDRLNGALIDLYDAFDLDGNKYDLMRVGAKMAEEFLT